MKKLSIYLPLIILFASCEKVIDVDLNSADPQYVIEADLRQGSSELDVIVTLTDDYFDFEAPTGVSDASVFFTDQDGLVYPVDHVNGGVYTLGGLNPQPGTYSLSVSINGDLTEASATMPAVVPIDTVYFEDVGGGPGFGGDDDDGSYEAHIFYNDPAGEENFYQLAITINGEEDEESGLIINDDQFNDGRYTEWPLFNRRFKEGDVIAFELRSIDPDVYDYLNQLNEILGGGGGPGGGSAAPANPESNLEGAISLGYFGAYSHSSATAEVK